jgi:lysozyme
VSRLSIISRMAVIVLLAQCLVCCGGVSAKSRYLSDSDYRRSVARAHVMPIQGIDVSKYQGDIDWRKARAAGVRFAFIKATEGGDYVDPNFLQNWEGAKQAGIARGAYHFVYWCRPANQQALWYMLNVPRDPDALPPVLDVEWNGHSSTCPKRIPPAEALQKIKVLLDALESYTGKIPIIYTDPVFYREVLEGHISGYPFWLRSVAAEPSQLYPGQPWAFWQFTTTGRVPGISGDVDRNSFNGTPDAWQRVLQTMEASR